MELDVRFMAAPAEFGEAYQWKWIEAGADSRTCGITTDHVPMCAGRNGWGQNGHYGEWQSGLREWGSGHRVSVIRTNIYRTCAVGLDGAVYCSGRAISGHGSNVQLPVPSSAPLVTIEIGSHHGCGLTADGRALCWGSNRYGQLGSGDLVDLTSLQPVAAGHVFTSIHVQAETTCGVTTARELWCWGLNDQRKLGRTRLAFSAVPIRLQVGSGVKQVNLAEYTGRKGACAIDATDRVLCWGGVPNAAWAVAPSAPTPLQ